MIMKCKFCPVVLRVEYEYDWDLYKHVILYHDAMQQNDLKVYFKKQKENIKMNICIICGVKRIKKEMIECLYCHGWVCSWKYGCTDKHLGNCDKDPEKENK